MYNKIIFLDIDGVLNSTKWSEMFYNKIQNKDVVDGETEMIDPNAVEMVCNLCEKENIRLVISSSWRLNTLQETKDLFSRYKYLSDLKPYIIGITPKFKDKNRGEEIQWWLENHKEYGHDYYHVYQNKSLANEFSWCIVDDDTDILDEQFMNFVHVNFEFGITENNIGTIINILNRKDLLWKQ